MSENNEMKELKNGKDSAYVMAVVGGATAGKATVVQEIVDELSNRKIHGRKVNVEVLHLESFFLENKRPLVNYQKYGNDYRQFYASCYDATKLSEIVRSIKNRTNEEIYIPGNSLRSQDQIITKNVDVLIVKGTCLLHYAQLRDLFDLKVYVQCDADTRLARRVMKYMSARTLDQILDEHDDHLKPCNDNFVRLTKRYSDVFVPKGTESVAAIPILAKYFEKILDH